MIFNILYALLLQSGLFFLNKKINYEHSYKKTSIVGSIFLGVLTSIMFASKLYSILYLTLFIGLLNISLIDFKYLEIPDTYNVAILALGVINVLLVQSYSMFITALVSFLLFLFISIISGGALGGGDIKLALGLGCFFTLFNYTSFLMYTFGVGALIALLIIIIMKKTKSDKVPFAPFMAMGTILALII